MTTDETAQAFREIDTLAADARRALDNGEDRHVASGHLVAIQLTAQAALRETLADPGTEAMDYAAGYLDRKAGVTEER